MKSVQRMLCVKKFTIFESPLKFQAFPDNRIPWGKSVNLSFPGILMILSNIFRVI